MGKFSTLRWKILFFFTILVLFFGLTLGYLSYESSKNLILSSIGSQAESVSQKAITYIDVDDYEKILTDIQAEPFSLEYAQTIVDSKEFRQMNKVLDEYRLSQGVRYVYAMSFLPNGEFIYVVDGFTILDKVTNGNGDAGISPPGMIEEDEYLIESAKKVYETKKILRGELVVAEDWGALLSSYTPIKDKNGEVIGVLGVDFNGDEIVKQLEIAKKNIILYTSAAIILAILLSFILSKMITKPLKSFASDVEQLKDGDFTVDFNSKSKDEFGVLSNSLRSTTQELNKMIKVINESAKNITTSSENLLLHSNESSQHADKTVGKIQQLQEKYNHQSDFVQNSVQTIYQMTEKFENMNQKTNHVYELSDSVTNTAIKGSKQMEYMTIRMDNLLEFQNEYSLIINELTDTTKEINQIVSTISSISNQTHLLALNASIEAARAGEHGKGFGVVANEVKKLAHESSKSVEHISNLISNIQSTVDKTVNRIDETSELIHSSSMDVKESSNMFLSIMDEIQTINHVLKDIKVESDYLFEDTKKTISSIEEVKELTIESSTIVRGFEEDLVEQQSKIRSLDNETASLSTLSKTLYTLIRKFKTK